MDQLNGKTAIVTGAAQGIGLAIARRFQDEGTNVVICDINEKMLAEAAESMSADNIRVNLILPGFVEGTGLPVPRGGYEDMRVLNPLQRNAQPKDIAEAALFLASDQSQHITGVLLNVDGGRHMATN